MPARRPSTTDTLIRRELQRALETFGASPEDVSLVDAVHSPKELYDALQRLGAKSDLLSIVGSWKDTMDDEWVLKAIRDWNWRLRPISGGRGGVTH